MSELRDRMIRDMMLRGFSPRTHKVDLPRFGGRCTAEVRTGVGGHRWLMLYHGWRERG